MKFRNIVTYQFPLVGWILLIFGLSAIPNVPSIRFVISPDKIAHAGIYCILCFVSHRAFFHQNRFPGLRSHALSAALLFTILYGILDEIHQRFVPGRTADVYDALADAFGGFLFVCWYWLRSRRRVGKSV